MDTDRVSHSVSVELDLFGWLICPLTRLLMQVTYWEMRKNDWPGGQFL